MALRHNHYDAAFEAWLRARRVPHVVVDEARRALLQSASLKSMDFIVTSRAGKNLLVDVKGRKFPSGGDGGSHTWENWATDDDLTSLVRWQSAFGDAFRATLVFAYDLVAPRHAARFPERFAFRGREYAFYGVGVDDYVGAMRARSPKWGTFTLPTADFRRLRRPVSELIGAEPSASRDPGL